MAAKISRVTYVKFANVAATARADVNEKKPGDWISASDESSLHVLRLLLSKPLRNLRFAKSGTFFRRFINNVARRARCASDYILFKYPGETHENKEATVHKPVLQRLSNRSRVCSSAKVEKIITSSFGQNSLGENTNANIISPESKCTQMKFSPKFRVSKLGDFYSATLEFP